MQQYTAPDRRADARLSLLFWWLLTGPAGFVVCTVICLHCDQHSLVAWLWATAGAVALLWPFILVVLAVVILGIQQSYGSDDELR